MLLDFKELPRFADAHIADMWPVYGVQGGIAYYEVKYSPLGEPHNSYAVISARTDDWPVVEFSERDLTHHERLGHLTRGVNFRTVRFGPQYIVAEDRNGDLLAEIGSRPVSVQRRLQTHIRMEGSPDAL